MFSPQLTCGPAHKPLNAWFLTATVAFIASAFIAPTCAVAQIPLVPSAPVAAKAASGPTKTGTQQTKTAVVTAGPSWAELTPAQKAALAPLATSWAGTAEPQKRKWLEISKNYPRLAPAEQATMHSRMSEWVALSPQQRAAARLNFAKTKELSGQLTPDEKKAKWETYQALTPEQKKDLAASAVQKPAGAATAVKPVAPQKLAVVPKPASSASASGGTAAASGATVAATAPGATPVPAAATLAPAAPAPAAATPVTVPPTAKP